MKLREHEGFQIRIVEIGGGHIAEIYRKEKLLKTIRREDGEPFRNAAIAHEAAKTGSIGPIQKGSSTGAGYRIQIFKYLLKILQKGNKGLQPGKK